MSAPIRVTQEQYDRWVQFQKESKICTPSTSPKFLTPEKEEKIVQAWIKNKGTVQATCREVKSGATTVKKVLRARGLL